MGSPRLTMRAVLGLTLWAGVGLTAQAQQLQPITVELACQTMPMQTGVAVTTPASNQFAQCKVEAIPSPKDPKVPMGYLVRDPAGKPFRQFVSYDGKNYNIRAFYLDGVESYREVYPLQNNEPVQFRWLGANGSKWGYDWDRDNKVDEWIAISPEEVSQELLVAVLTRDAKRAEALAVTKANLEALSYPAADAQKILERAAGIGKKVIEAADALKAAPDAKWLQVQLSAPQTIPGDAFNSKHDLVMYKNATIIVQEQNGKNTKFVQMGDLIQIGRAWKLVDGPGGNTPDMGLASGPIPPEIEALLPKLNALDQVPAAALEDPAALSAHNAKRVEILEQIVAKLPPDKQESWVKLLVEALSAAAEGEKPDGKNIAKLKQFKESLEKNPNQALAAFVVYRYLMTENNIASNTPQADYPAVQEKFRASLEEFAKTFANSEEAPEAILRVAMAYEYQKDGEPKAKEWYKVLAERYSKHPHALKAIGAIKRLESEGKPFELAGPNLATGQPFNTASLSGGVVVVYYCAKWSHSLATDIKQLQAIADKYGPKGLQVVTVSLDKDINEAKATVEKIPGTKLFMPGGLDASPLASSYGVVLIPQMFIVGKDGKVVNRNAQINTLDDDVKKLLP